MLINRCGWVKDDPLYIHYHDHEWGVPIHDDRLLFEYLILEGMQAGLSWFTILKKRNNYRKCFDNFNAEKIANYNQNKICSLLDNASIIRNKLKINAVIHNAKVFLAVQNEWESFSKYIWHFVNYQPIQNHWQTKLPAYSKLSEKIASDLKKQGFKFMGRTICYAFMQAIGMVNDHITSCFRYQELNKKYN